MTTAPSKIGLGGGCHWCTEGVFESLIGITKVKQGWIASSGEHADFSEAVEVYFDAAVISLSELIEIHLYTHASSSNHSMRGKYRSAIYTYNDIQFEQVLNILHLFKTEFATEIITQVHECIGFKENKIELQNYFYSAPERPFCKTYIHPKLILLLDRFNRHVDQSKIAKVSFEVANHKIKHG
jgi:peptide-methionine (S)-S-oxide reductase